MPGNHLLIAGPFRSVDAIRSSIGARHRGAGSGEVAASSFFAVYFGCEWSVSCGRERVR
jgi:hypothetical protein